MALLRRIAQSNTAVIFTIHQPSSDIFASFDNLILLNKGRAWYQSPSFAMRTMVGVRLAMSSNRPMAWSATGNARVYPDRGGPPQSMWSPVERTRFRAFAATRRGRSARHLPQGCRSVGVERA